MVKKQLNVKLSDEAHEIVAGYPNKTELLEAAIRFYAEYHDADGQSIVPSIQEANQEIEARIAVYEARIDELHKRIADLKEYNESISLRHDEIQRNYEALQDDFKFTKNALIKVEEPRPSLWQRLLGKG